ncbi:hypothetical protein AAVH_08770 [Aphelenchoides avenae]|nr:hypothetical protein AAVH_08770 [Aphelenchus avenae]
MATRSVLKQKESAGSNKHVTFNSPIRNFAGTDGASSNGGPMKKYAKSPLRPASDNDGPESPGQKRGLDGAPMDRENPQKRRREDAHDDRSVAEKAQDAYNRATNLENGYAELAQKTCVMTEKFAVVVSLQKSVVFRHTDIDYLKWDAEQKIVAKKTEMNAMDEQLENVVASKKRAMEALYAARPFLDMDA